MSEMVYLTINGKDAKSEWGVVTSTNTLSALLAPAPMKDNPSFVSRLENGSRIDTSDPKVAQRELTLEIQMTADSPDQFYSRHESLCEELQEGTFTLSTTDRPDVVYHLIYTSCSAYTQFCRGIATLSLKCTEPDPTNRTADE